MSVDAVRWGGPSAGPVTVASQAEVEAISSEVHTLQEQLDDARNEIKKLAKALNSAKSDIQVESNESDEKLRQKLQEEEARVAALETLVHNAEKEKANAPPIVDLSRRLTVDSSRIDALETKFETLRQGGGGASAVPCSIM